MKDNFIYERYTSETKIYLRINFNRNISFRYIDTGIDFLNHLLDQMSFNGNFSIYLLCKGDINTDYHHTFEDLGIVFGKVFKNFFIYRLFSRYFSSFLVMDESITKIFIDVSGRSFFKFKVSDKNFVPSYIGNISFGSIYEFFRSFAYNSMISIHIFNSGKDIHHRMESIFKCFGLIIRKMLVNSYKRSVFSTKDIL